MEFHPHVFPVFHSRAVNKENHFYRTQYLELGSLQHTIDRMMDNRCAFATPILFTSKSYGLFNFVGATTITQQPNTMNRIFSPSWRRQPLARLLSVSVPAPAYTETISLAHTTVKPIEDNGGTELPPIVMLHGVLASSGTYGSILRRKDFGTLSFLSSTPVLFTSTLF